MWVEINSSTQSISTEGFVTQVTALETMLYIGDLPDGARSIEAAINSDFCAVVEIPAQHLPVRFARDYLGKIPLLYACLSDRIFISDELNEVYGWLVKNGVTPKISETSVAMYFIAGYVPQGMCIFDPIAVCRNASIYEWNGSSVEQHSVFSSIVSDQSLGIDIVGEAIDQEVKEIGRKYSNIDVWCSGGIDSSTIAMLFNRNGLKSELLTLSYGKPLLDAYGEGEIPHARTMARTCSVPMRTVELDEEMYVKLHASFVSKHHSPAIDTCLLAKYALSGATRSVAVTGEGGDPVFGGVKNDFVTYYHYKHPKVPLGEIYSLSHKRFGPNLESVLVRGDELNCFATEYFEWLLEEYDGDLIRKLFYLNTFEKQGGMIFPESYYPAKRSSIRIHHPLTSMRVYKAAFSLSDDKRYVYPQGKLVLSDLYRCKLPSSIVSRTKSGTQIPLRAYLAAMHPSAFELNALRMLPMFREDFLNSVIDGRLTIANEPLIIYALITLNQFLEAKR